MLSYPRGAGRGRRGEGGFNTFLNIPSTSPPPSFPSRKILAFLFLLFILLEPSPLLPSYNDSSIRGRVVFLKVETNNTITFRFRLLKKQDIAVWLADIYIYIYISKSSSLYLSLSLPPLIPIGTRYTPKLDILKTRENYYVGRRWLFPRHQQW